MYVVVSVFECLAIYLLFVKMQGLALEEIALLFDGENANVAGTNLALDQHGELKTIRRGEE